MANFVRERVKRLMRKHEDLRRDNEEFQNLVVKELEGLNLQLQRKKNENKA